MRPCLPASARTTALLPFPACTVARRPSSSRVSRRLLRSRSPRRLPVFSARVSLSCRTREAITPPMGHDPAWDWENPIAASASQVDPYPAMAAYPPGAQAAAYPFCCRQQVLPSSVNGRPLHKLLRMRCAKKAVTTSSPFPAPHLRATGATLPRWSPRVSFLCFAYSAFCYIIVDDDGAFELQMASMQFSMYWPVLL